MDTSVLAVIMRLKWNEKNNGITEHVLVEMVMIVAHRVIAVLPSSAMIVWLKKLDIAIKTNKM